MPLSISLSLMSQLLKNKLPPHQQAEGCVRFHSVCDKTPNRKGTGGFSPTTDPVTAGSGRVRKIEDNNGRKQAAYSQ